MKFKSLDYWIERAICLILGYFIFHLIGYSEKTALLMVAVIFVCAIVTDCIIYWFKKRSKKK